MFPSPVEGVLVVQLLGSRPAPTALSAQFHRTVTSEVFQLLALAAGIWVGLDVGAAASTCHV